MDEARARRIAQEISGQKFGKWRAGDYIGHGKSAVVVKAIRRGEIGVLKVFDPELVERHGRATQLARVEREKSLIGLRHPNLIEILGGGECRKSKLIYVVMSYLSYPNLAEKLTIIPREVIFSILKQVASAARFLEDMELAHRDIKPANIAISPDFRKAVLLDLGVLRPIGLSDITDTTDQRVFVGTLRYSPPEFLYRTEKDTPQGWRAITFYQLGAVLHDMIMRRPLFKEYSEPYARLVDAVREVKPIIRAEDVDGRLIHLAECSLVKDPELRLSLVNWDSFMKPAIGRDSKIDEFRERILKKQVVIREGSGEGNRKGIEGLAYEVSLRFSRMIDELCSAIRSICLSDRECFPNLSLTHDIEVPSEEALISLRFKKSISHGLPSPLTLFIRLRFLSSNEDMVSLTYQAFLQGQPSGPTNEGDFPMVKLYTGPFALETISNRVQLTLLAIVEKAMQLPADFSSIATDDPVPVKIEIDQTSEDSDE